LAERAADLRSSAAFLRQRWLVLLGAGVVGLGLGVLYASRVPPQLGSTALVLLHGAAAGGSSDSGTAQVDTQVRVALSTPVLQRAGESVTPSLSASTVLDSVDVESVTSQIISIEAFSAHAGRAQAVAQAVAQAYVDTVQGNAFSVTGQTLKALQTRDADLTEQIKDNAVRLDGLKQRVRREDPRSSAGSQDARLIDRFTADQSDLALQRDKVREDLAASQPVTGAAQTAAIIQPAAPATGPDRVQRLALWALSGALVVMACVATVLLIRWRRDPRLRARDDVADAVGSSVLADVRSRPQRSVAEWTALFETYQASAVDAWAFRQLLRTLAAAPHDVTAVPTGSRRGAGRVEHPSSVTIVTLAGDRGGIAIGPQLAAFAASLGVTTRFVVSTGQDGVASLWAACSTDRSSGPRPGLQLDVLSDVPPAAVTGDPGPIPTEFDELLFGVSSGHARSNGDLAHLVDEHLGVRTFSSLDAIVGAAHVRSGDDAGEDLRGAPADDGADVADDEARVASDEIDLGDEEFPAVQAASPAADEESPAADEEPPAADEEPPAADEEADAGHDDADEPEPVMTTSGEDAPTLRFVPRHPSAALTVVLAVVDRREPTMRDLPATAVTALAISPGVGTREDLARLAVAVDDAGRRIDGIVIADPDPSDRTTGRRTLGERARQAPLPVRMTGSSQVPLSAVERRGGR